MQKGISITVLGKPTQLVFKKLGRFRIGKHQVLGYCESPDCDPCHIYVDSRLAGKKKMEIVLHEMLHRAGWHIDEEFITRLAADAANVLDQLGFKETD
jgi:hypothetical protein